MLYYLWSFRIPVLFKLVRTCDRCTKQVEIKRLVSSLHFSKQLNGRLECQYTKLQLLWVYKPPRGTLLSSIEAISQRIRNLTDWRDEVFNISAGLAVETSTSDITLINRVESTQSIFALKMLLWIRKVLIITEQFISSPIRSEHAYSAITYVKYYQILYFSPGWSNLTVLFHVGKRAGGPGDS